MLHLLIPAPCSCGPRRTRVFREKRLIRNQPFACVGTGCDFSIAPTWELPPTSSRLKNQHLYMGNPEAMTSSFVYGQPRGNDAMTSSKITLNVIARSCPYRTAWPTTPRGSFWSLGCSCWSRWSEVFGHFRCMIFTEYPAVWLWQLSNFLFFPTQYLRLLDTPVTCGNRVLVHFMFLIMIIV